jgi:hypothetical protein
MAPPPRRLLLALCGFLAAAALATLAVAVYEDQVGLADWYVHLARPSTSIDPIRSAPLLPRLDLISLSRRSGTSSL